MFNSLAGLIEPQVLETKVVIGSDFSSGAVFTLLSVNLREEIDVPAGTFLAAHIRVDVGGEIMGGGDFVFETDMFLHAEQFIVRMVNGPAYALMELVEHWS